MRGANPKVIFTAVCCIVCTALHAGNDLFLRSLNGYTDYTWHTGRQDSIVWGAGLSAVVSSGRYAPFWLSANRDGMISVAPFSGNMSLARRLHILGAYWGFLLMSLHLGLHWNMILGMFRKVAGIKGKAKSRSMIAFIIGLIIAGYGIWVFISRDFPTYLILKSEFVFLDYSESKFLFYIDYLAIIGLCIFIAHYGTKLIRKKKKPEES